MKSTSLLVVAVVGATLAKPHSHRHQKRDRVVVYKNVVEQACRLTGAGGAASRNLAYADCHRGLQNGTYKALGSGQFPFREVSTLITTTIVEQPTPAPVKEAPVKETPAIATPKPAVLPSPPTHVRVPYLDQGLSTERSSYSMLNENFPNGKFSCSRFPSEFATRVPWLNLGGWAAVQAFSGQNADGKLVGLANQVNTNCFAGTYCAYSCPEGMLPAQWPVEHQGAEGQSIGGLLCGKDEKLYLTRASVTEKLCIEGSTRATAWIKNNLDEEVSICRTSYPGDESMTMWQTIAPGERQQLAIIDQKSYYRTRTGAPTSGQYYLNRKGKAAEAACTWGNEKVALGNWSPVNLGLGWAEKDIGYFAMFNNAPTQQSATLGYKVAMEGGDAPCYYDNVNIKYNGNSWDAFGPKAQGCTVAVYPGAIFNITLTP